MKKLSITFVLVSCLLTGGCASQTFHLNKGNAILRKQEMHSFFIGGIGQAQHRNADRVCGGADKVSKVETYWNFGHYLIGAVTFGIYTPRGAKIYCTE